VRAPSRGGVVLLALQAGPVAMAGRTSWSTINTKTSDETSFRVQILMS
jgi:hypothetical protein